MSMIQRECKREFLLEIYQINNEISFLVTLFVLMLYDTVNNFSVMLGSWIEPVLKRRIKCLAQGHNAHLQIATL